MVCHVCPVIRLIRFILLIHYQPPAIVGTWRAMSTLPYTNHTSYKYHKIYSSTLMNSLPIPLIPEGSNLSNPWFTDT